MTTSQPTKVTVDIRCSDPRWEAAISDIEPLCCKALETAATHVTVPANAEVALLFTDDAEMQALNANWRKMDKPTDVLSFPSSNEALPDGTFPLGDIALGWETCHRDAENMVRDLRFHISHLVTHGFLHLMGYDHIQTADADVMEKLETEILASLGWPAPYEQDAQAAARQS